MSDTYIRTGETAKRAGLSLPAFRRRVRAGLIPTYADPHDLRYRLVRMDELDEFLHNFRPIPQRQETQGQS